MSRTRTIRTIRSIRTILRAMMTRALLGAAALLALFSCQTFTRTNLVSFSELTEGSDSGFEERWAPVAQAAPGSVDPQIAVPLREDASGMSDQPFASDEASEALDQTREDDPLWEWDGESNLWRLARQTAQSAASAHLIQDDPDALAQVAETIPDSAGDAVQTQAVETASDAALSSDGAGAAVQAQAAGIASDAVGRKVKERIKFLFVPTAHSNFDSQVFAPVLSAYVKLLDVDLVVITGERSRILTVVKDFDQDAYATAMILRDGLALCKQDFVSRANSGYVEFANFAIQLYQKEIKGERFSLSQEDTSSSESLQDAFGMDVFEKIRNSDKPSLVFASPLEPSYYDMVALAGENYAEPEDPSLRELSFAQSFEENGYSDAFNAYRYSAPTIGSAHPGFTYGDENGNFRIDFVLFKNMVPISVMTLYMTGISDLADVRRYAIFGEMAL